MGMQRKIINTGHVKRRGYGCYVESWDIRASVAGMQEVRMKLKERELLPGVYNERVIKWNLEKTKEIREEVEIVQIY